MHPCSYIPLPRVHHPAWGKAKEVVHQQKAFLFCGAKVVGYCPPSARATPLQQSQWPMMYISFTRCRQYPSTRNGTERRCVASLNPVRTHDTRAACASMKDERSDAAPRWSTELTSPSSWMQQSSRLHPRHRALRCNNGCCFRQFFFSDGIHASLATSLTGWRQKFLADSFPVEHPGRSLNHHRGMVKRCPIMAGTDRHTQLFLRAHCRGKK